MKVLIRKEATNYDNWIYIFGTGPVAVDEIPGNHSRLRVRLAEMKALQRQRWRRHISETLHLTEEQTAKLAPVVSLKDVTVVEELFPEGK